MKPTRFQSGGSSKLAYLFVTINLVVMMLFLVSTTDSASRLDEFHVIYHQLTREWLSLRIGAMLVEPADTQAAAEFWTRVESFRGLLGTATNSAPVVAVARLTDLLDRPLTELVHGWPTVRDELVQVSEGTIDMSSVTADLDAFQHHLDDLRLAIESVTASQRRAFDMLLYCLGAMILVTIVVFLFAEVESTQRLRGARLMSLLARSSLEAQEAERLRIARALHDSLSQELTVASIEQELLLSDGDAGVSVDRDELSSRARLRLERAIEWVRNLAHELRPVTLERHGLANAIDAYCNERASQFRGTIQFTAPDQPVQLTADRAANAYRIMQEAVTNAIRHAQAEKITVTLETNGPNVQLAVADDGKGLPARWSRPGFGRTGMTGMRERAALLDGELSVRSPRRGGTVVTLSFPKEVS